MLEDRIRIFRTDDAARHASSLFSEAFHAPFPVPRDNCGLPIPTPAEAWHQYVAVYRWPDGSEETVGFSNFIRHNDVYLHGGMCVKGNFYRRLPRDDWSTIREAGGVAQMIMTVAASELNDAVAWFGYCGDRKALAVDLRAGYEPTSEKFLIAKWFKPLPLNEKQRLILEIASIGPF